MRVFISWSGELSHAVAMALHDWLPHVINAVKPYVSSKDIGAGEQWFSNITTQLQATDFGIICVTRENIAEPWLLFEAGALSRSINRAKVTPLLVDVSHSELFGPLAAFQAMLCTTDDLLHLVKTIRGQMEKPQLSEGQLAKAFEKWWPDLDREINAARKRFPALSPAAPSGAEATVTRLDSEVLDNLIKNNRTILRAIEEVLTSVKCLQRSDLASEVIGEGSDSLDMGSPDRFPTGIQIMMPKFRNLERRARESIRRGVSNDVVLDQLVSGGVPEKEAVEFVRNLVQDRSGT